MLTEDLIRKVRQIEFSVRRIVDDMMAGQYKSFFKGTGVQFSEHRQYYAGDDIRHIDWNVSARSRDLLVKKFEEERELNLLLVVDVSGSEQFGSSVRLKSEILAELAGMLAYAAVHTGDKVGALLFASEVEKIIRPKKGRGHILRLIRDMLAFQPKTRGTNLAGALEGANRILKHKGIVVILSDFQARDWQVPLRKLARRHDVIAVWIQDERESKVPRSGLLEILDPETGETSTIDIGSMAFQRWLEGEAKSLTKETAENLRGKRVDVLKLSSKEDAGEALVRFFNRRRARR